MKQVEYFLSVYLFDGIGQDEGLLLRVGKNQVIIFAITHTEILHLRDIFSEEKGTLLSNFYFVNGLLHVEGHHCG